MSPQVEKVSERPLAKGVGTTDYSVFEPGVKAKISKYNVFKYDNGMYAAILFFE